MPVCIPGDQLGGDPDFPQAELREISGVLGHTDYFFSQLLLLFVAHPLATRHASTGASGIPPPGQGGAPKVETTRKPAVGGL
jgi:hypothetical protein